jgi:hypothetical protein
MTFPLLRLMASMMSDAQTNPGGPLAPRGNRPPNSPSRGPTRHDEIWLSRWKATTNRDRQLEDAGRDRLPQKPKDDVPLGFVLGPLARTDSRTDRPYRGDDTFEVFKTRYLENLHGHLRESSIRRPASVIRTRATSNLRGPVLIASRL